MGHVKQYSPKGTTNTCRRVQIQVTQLQTYTILKNLKKLILKNVFEKSVEFFLVEMKAQWEEFGGRTFLGDNTDGCMVKPRPIKFQRVGFWISTEIRDIYMYSGSYVYSILTCEKFDLRRVFRNVTRVQLCYVKLHEEDWIFCIVTNEELIRTS